MWKLQADGQLHIVYVTASHGLIKEEDKLPDELIWGREDHMGWYDSPEAVEKELRNRFKKKNIEWALLGEAPREFWVRPIEIYFIDWPGNIARLLFNNFLDYIKVLENEYQDSRVVGVLEIALEIARAVDKIQEDVERSHTILVQKELDRASKLYEVA